MTEAGHGCMALFGRADALVESAGVRDAASHRLSGFPYLRSSRLISALAYRESPDVWLERMRALDMHDRRIELANLPEGLAEKLDNALLARLQLCGRERVLSDLASSRRLDQIRLAAQVPDEYADWRRVAGFYPLAVPGLKLGISDWRHAARERLASPPATENSAEIVSYAAGAVTVDKQFTLSAELLRRHAPVFVLELESPDDRIGIPRRRGGRLFVDTQRAEVYYLHAQTLFDGELLDQIVYVAWLPARTATRAIDPYAGALDGFIWRVTLDRDGAVLLYDSIHACGCFHQAIPGPRLRPRYPTGWNEEGLFIAGKAPGHDTVSVRLTAGQHYLQSVTAHPPHRNGKTQSYTLQPYDALRMNRPERLFDKRGLVSGSERAERFFLWPSGVPSPGAMRQWGRHATAFVGKRHFDDARLFDRYFRRVSE